MYPSPGTWPTIYAQSLDYPKITSGACMNYFVRLRGGGLGYKLLTTESVIKPTTQLGGRGLDKIGAFDASDITSGDLGGSYT